MGHVIRDAGTFRVPETTLTKDSCGQCFYFGAMRGGPDGSLLVRRKLMEWLFRRRRRLLRAGPLPHGSPCTRFWRTSTIARPHNRVNPRSGTAESFFTTIPTMKGASRLNATLQELMKQQTQMRVQADATRALSRKPFSAIASTRRFGRPPERHDPSFWLRSCDFSLE